MSTGSPKRVAILGKIAHYLTAFTVLLKGFDKVAVPGKAGFAVVLIVIGLFILFGTIFHHRFEKALRHFDGIIAFLEAVTIGIVGYLYLKDGKELIQYICFFAAGMFLIAAVIHFTNPKARTSKH